MTIVNREYKYTGLHDEVDEELTDSVLMTKHKHDFERLKLMELAAVLSLKLLIFKPLQFWIESTRVFVCDLSVDNQHDLCSYQRLSSSSSLVFSWV